MRCRHSYGDSRYMETISAIECKTYNEFIVIGGFWYTECYKNVTHQTNINSLIKRFNKVKKSSDIPLISNVKLGRRPKHSPVDESESLPSRTQRTVRYNKELSIITKNCPL